MSTETNQPINVAIAGCGIIGQPHAAAVGELPGLHVTALVDEIPEAAEAMAERIEGTGAARPATFGSPGCRETCGDRKAAGREPGQGG